MSITINVEIGHNASLRTKTTPEGFTHDWEVYVRGCNGAEIHYYVEKVVFHLHETFPKPKRVVKEPPYSLRTSGYAGFNLPIEIYLRNNQEPKKIIFNYDLQLQPRGPPINKVQEEKYVFYQPSEEFRSKLLKGGGLVGSTGSTQEVSDSKATDEKSQMISKPKLSGSDVPKKHKIKPEEPRNTDFLNLFGTPITKTTSKAPEPPKLKEVPKSFPKLEKPVDKDKIKTKSAHKDKEKDKSKDKDKSSDSSEKKKEEKKKSKEDKNKERERVKEKSSKKDKERDKSPSSRPRSPSPKRSPKRPPSPPPQKHNSSREKDKELSKDERKDKDRKDEKKNKKEKREHKESKHKDRDKDKEHKEHKNRESKSSKDSSSSNLKEKEIGVASVNLTASQLQQKNEKKEKSKESLKEPKDDDKLEKSRLDKSEDKQKHKHKKKDRKEKREDKYSSKTEKKSEKPSGVMLPAKEDLREPPPVSSTRDTDKSNLFGSPKSEPPSTPNQVETKEKSTNNLTFKDEDISNDSLKVSSRESSPHRAPCKSPSEPPPELVKKPEPEKKKEESPKKKEKKEKKKDKKSDRDHERRRKRKSPQTHTEVEQPPEKLLKEEENNNSDDERKVSSTEDANPLPKNEAEDYMGMLRDLQHKIMGLKDNSDLQKVVQLIAETGRYEVSAHTFDFDLCLLDRSTVRQLQDFFASIS